MKKRRVLVGMSGGIDSSAVCLMLQEQGYEVIGVTMRVWDLPSQLSSPSQELPDHILEARSIARQLGIQHYVADERKQFKEQIAGYFVQEYLNGRTPNPCVMCNPLFKFRILTEWADRTGCPLIATGHYSRIEVRGNLRYITVGDDPEKDQSYFLWRLGQDVLARCLFPLGGYTKLQVRDYLRRKGFKTKAEEKESMEVCFIENDYRTFLREQVTDIDERIGRGWFVSPSGIKLGEHKGFPYYTVGQRKGLEIALGHPAYVLKTNPQKNTVMLGDAEQLKAEYMLTEDVHAPDLQELFTTKDLTVRIRYRSRPVACETRLTEDGYLLVHFKEEASAIAPGQSAVFYDGRRVVGGAFIASQRGLNMYIP